MATQFTPQLQSEYQRLFDTCVVNLEKLSEINSIVSKIKRSKSRYEMVGDKLSIPWYFIGIIHSLEGGGNFKTHLHNGDPLTARTVQVPKGRPKTGNPPFEWEFSAEDALTLEGLDQWKDWSIPGILFKLEGYNGYGYHKATININSPYLWSYSNHYTKGKFVKDGVFSPTAVSKQCGAAILLRRLIETQALPVEISDKIFLIKQLGATVVFAPNRIVEKARELQQLLNLAGAHLLADGKAGRNTSDAYFRFTGSFLPGDTEGMPA
jgi:lysozyme family protein